MFSEGGCLKWEIDDLKVEMLLEHNIPMEYQALVKLEKKKFYKMPICSQKISLAKCSIEMDEWHTLNTDEWN